MSILVVPLLPSSCGSVRVESGGVVQSYGIRWRTGNTGDGMKGWTMSEGQCHILYFLGPSPSSSGFPVTFPPVPDHFRMFYAYFRRSVLLCCLLDYSVIRSFRVFCLFLSIPLFRLVSFQFSILGSDRSESGSPSDPFTFLFSHNPISH